VTGRNNDLDVLLPQILEYQKPTEFDSNPYDTSKLNWNCGLELGKIKTEFEMNNHSNLALHEYLQQQMKFSKTK
jgi:hypothetical protein